MEYEIIDRKFKDKKTNKICKRQTNLLGSRICNQIDMICTNRNPRTVSQITGRDFGGSVEVLGVPPSFRYSLIIYCPSVE